MTRSPALFADVITWAFKRSDGQPEEPVDAQTIERRATIVYSILWELRTLPGLQEDGSVDPDQLMTWVNEARRLCRERDRVDTGDHQIGQILANAPADEDGVWPCRLVRDVLDQLASVDIGNGFTTGKINLRGVTSRSILDGGKQELSIAASYRQDATKALAKWPFTAHLLHRLADAFDAEARQHDQKADWLDQFES